jgi:protein SCO1/2
MIRRRPLLLSACALALNLVACERANSAKSAFDGIDITGADYARVLDLPDAAGKPRQLGDFKGDVVAVFFGYTQCPDVCPATMAELALVKKQLGAQGSKLQVLFVTVDPERDTPPLLKAYMANFDPGFVALRGTLAQLKAVAREFKVYYAKVPGRTEGSYSMDHTAGTYIFDKAGHVRVFARYGADPAGLTHDIKLLLDEPA